MDDPSTDALRKLAPSWTLAGDEQLLSILQNTHQRLVSKCQEANSQLEQMATALNDASISLQNVNNQFMALSSSQFIERRVYDDDDVSTDVPAVKEQPKPEVRDELSCLKRSISVLENAHEIITILQDSDTESDTDDEMPARMVLKPKDMYANRPLPYIIGSQPWKNKWHAGLLLEESDSDSTASKVEHDSDQYSQSEPEDTHTDKLPVPIHTQTTVSETSSELPSEQGSVPKPTPSDVASEIARRLGAREPAKIVEREPEDEEPPKPTVRKIYRPQDPVSSTIFPDEPPPLSEHSDSESDIFAELHRAPPHARAPPYQTSGAADDLFGADQQDSDDGDIFSDFANKPTTNPTAKPASLFDSGPAPNMFVKHTDHDSRRNHMPDDNHRRRGYDDDDDGRKVYEERGVGDDLRGRGDEPERVKKPIGGISLFGNKGTESIGAAILNRNQRKSSTSGDESGSDSRSESQTNQQIRKEKDIFDDLFARSENKKVTKEKDFTKDLKTEIKKKVEVKEKKVEKPKVDLFSDNLFDDIDDIFSTNVVKMPAKDTAKSKSIFEDDDDLFSEIAAPKPVKIEVAASSSNKKSLFDSDDELFSENKSVDKPKETPKPVVTNKPNVAESKINETSKVNKEINKSIFDDDEDELFGASKTNEVSKVQNKPVSLAKPNDFGKEDNKNNAPKNTFKSPSLFDDDDDESDIFAGPVKTTKVQNIITAPIKETKVSSQTDEQIHTKLSRNTDEEIPTTPSSQIEVKISEENVESSSSVKTIDSDDNIVKNENVEINENLNRTTVDKIIDNSEIEKNLDKEDSVLPVSKNVDRDNKNVETNAARIFGHIRNIEQSSTDTNDDFSDQDFDDLPPKEEKTKPVIDNSNIVTEKHSIFDKVTLEEDIDELFAATHQQIIQKKTDNSESIFNTEPDFTEDITKKTENDNKKEETPPQNIETDIFSNILTEPPVFEKPKEPKKSKNVNALFDDDSDDESLFFKKNDTIFVENPQEFTPTQDRIFGLFTDEPPDDGFSKISDDFDDDMFSTLPKPKIPQREYPPIPDTVHFDDDIPEIEKTDQVEDISSNLPKEEAKPAFEVAKESSLDKEEDIFKVKTTETVVEKQKSTTVLSDDEQLFNVPTKEPTPPSKENLSLDLSDEENLFATGIDKPTSSKKEIPVTKNISPIKSKPDIKEKPSLDIISDDENLFTSEKPNSFETVKEKSAPEDKIVISKEKSSLDMLSDDENLFNSESKVDTTPPLMSSKPNNEDVHDKPNIATFSDEENLFGSKSDTKKPTLKNKPSLDLLSDDENLFGSGPKLEKTSTKIDKPVPASKKPTLQDKSTADSFSDDENLFGSESKLEKPSSLTSTTLDKPIPASKKPALQDKPTADSFSDDENLFGSGSKLEKPPSLTSTKLDKPVPASKKPALEDKPTADSFSDDENLFGSGSKLEKAPSSTSTKLDKPVPASKKPTLQDKPASDLFSDDENLFGSGSKVEKPPSLTSTKLDKPVPASKKPGLQDKPTADSFSDDENLFGSGSKLEKPPLLTSTKDKPLPAFNKPALQDKPGSDSFSDDENLFSSKPVSKFEKPTISTQEKHVSENKNLESVSKSSDDELFSSLEKTEKPLITESKLKQQDSKSDEDIFKIPAKSEFLSKPSEVKPEKSEKKVGKLKVGLNINVNALLPGASPKKIKPNDQPDGQSQSQSVAESQKPEPKVHAEVRKSEPESPSQSTDSKLQKVVSFEGKPESDVLDNKLSKERAKIQVKRRPSTRRARREAVRKSGIDFGEDSTDNSSSIDDPPRKPTVVTQDDTKSNENIQNILPSRSEVEAKLDHTAVQAKIDPIAVEKQPIIEPEKQAEVIEKPSYSRKVVYILNDEDIFNTSPVESINKNISKNLDSNVGVSTLGKVYDKDVENKSKKESKSSLFGAETDDQMFKPKAVVKKTTIFDSDSEEDLFGSASKEEERKVEKVEVKREIKREVVKGSLFGDDDEDDDLFGVKAKKIVDQKPQPSRSTVKETPKLAEPVFEDPLSMFGDDD